MRKLLYIALVCVAVTSCKTQQKAAVVTEQAADETKSRSEIIEGHYKNKRDFTTLSINANARYKDKKQTHNLTADIRIKKDEMILVSIKFFGITMAKAQITPDKVSYYEKINGTYFEGSYLTLSKWLGADLDFNKVQNMLTGEALDDLTKGSYKENIEGGKYKLTSKEKSFTKEFLFEGANYLLKQQIIAQGGNSPRSLEIMYPAHKEYTNGILPAQVNIEAVQQDKVNINIEYTSVKFNEALTFPYSVPEGFEQIFID